MKETDNLKTELMNCPEYYDLSDEEYKALESWLKEGNSPHSNPDHYCDTFGVEVDYLEWYRILKDYLPSCRFNPG